MLACRDDVLVEVAGVDVRRAPVQEIGECLDIWGVLGVRRTQAQEKKVSVLISGRSRALGLGSRVWGLGECLDIWEV